MKPQRRLMLKRESLTGLDTDDMRAVVGGTHIFTDCGCVTHGLSCEACPTPTLPINECVDNVVESLRVCIAFPATSLCTT